MNMEGVKSAGSIENGFSKLSLSPTEWFVSKYPESIADVVEDDFEGSLTCACDDVGDVY